jgi:hypothetical protein
VPSIARELARADEGTCCTDALPLSESVRVGHAGYSTAACYPAPVVSTIGSRGSGGSDPHGSGMTLDRSAARDGGGGHARPPVLELVAVSFLALFLELAMIRFINSTVQVVAHFNNFLIISAFLGLGAGSCLTSSRRNLFSLMPVVFPLVVGLMVGLDAYGFESDLSEVVLWAVRQPGRSLGTVPTILLVFGANFVFFLPLGYQLGACLRRFENRLVGYGYDPSAPSSLATTRRRMVGRGSDPRRSCSGVVVAPVI